MDMAMSSESQNSPKAECARLGAVGHKPLIPGGCRAGRVDLVAEQNVNHTLPYSAAPQLSEALCGKLMRGEAGPHCLSYHQDSVCQRGEKTLLSLTHFWRRIGRSRKATVKYSYGNRSSAYTVRRSWSLRALILASSGAACSAPRFAPWTLRGGEFDWGGTSVK